MVESPRTMAGAIKNKKAGHKKRVANEATSSATFAAAAGGGVSAPVATLRLLKQKLAALREKQRHLVEYYDTTKGHSYVRDPHLQKLSQQIADLENEVGGLENGPGGAGHGNSILRRRRSMFGGVSKNMRDTTDDITKLVLSSIHTCAAAQIDEPENLNSTRRADPSKSLLSLADVVYHQWFVCSLQDTDLCHALLNSKEFPLELVAPICVASPPEMLEMIDPSVSSSLVQRTILEKDRSTYSYLHHELKRDLVVAAMTFDQSREAAAQSATASPAMSPRASGVFTSSPSMANMSPNAAAGGSSTSTFQAAAPSIQLEVRYFLKSIANGWVESITTIYGDLAWLLPEADEFGNTREGYALSPGQKRLPSYVRKQQAEDAARGGAGSPTARAFGVDDENDHELMTATSIMKLGETLMGGLGGTKADATVALLAQGVTPPKQVQQKGGISPAETVDDITAASAAALVGTEALRNSPLQGDATITNAMKRAEQAVVERLRHIAVNAATLLLRMPPLIIHFLLNVTVQQRSRVNKSCKTTRGIERRVRAASLAPSGKQRKHSTANNTNHSSSSSADALTAVDLLLQGRQEYISNRRHLTEAQCPFLSTPPQGVVPVAAEDIQFEPRDEALMSLFALSSKKGLSPELWRNLMKEAQEIARANPPSLGSTAFAAASMGSMAFGSATGLRGAVAQHRASVYSSSSGSDEFTPPELTPSHHTLVLQAHSNRRPVATVVPTFMGAGPIAGTTSPKLVVAPPVSAESSVAPVSASSRTVRAFTVGRVAGQPHASLTPETPIAMVTSADAPATPDAPPPKAILPRSVTVRCDTSVFTTRKFYNITVSVQALLSQVPTSDGFGTSRFGWVRANSPIATDGTRESILGSHLDDSFGISIVPLHLVPAAVAKLKWTAPQTLPDDESLAGSFKAASTVSGALNTSGASHLQVNKPPRTRRTLTPHDTTQGGGGMDGSMGRSAKHSHHGSRTSRLTSTAVKDHNDKTASSPKGGGSANPSSAANELAFVVMKHRRGVVQYASSPLQLFKIPTEQADVIISCGLDNEAKTAVFAVDATYLGIAFDEVGVDVDSPAEQGWFPAASMVVPQGLAAYWQEQKDTGAVAAASTVYSGTATGGAPRGGKGSATPRQQRQNTKGASGTNATGSEASAGAKTPQSARSSPVQDTVDEADGSSVPCMAPVAGVAFLIAPPKRSALQQMTQQRFRYDLHFENARRTVPQMGARHQQLQVATKKRESESFTSTVPTSDGGVNISGTFSSNFSGTANSTTMPQPQQQQQHRGSMPFMNYQAPKALTQSPLLNVAFQQQPALLHFPSFSPITSQDKARLMIRTMCSYVERLHHVKDALGERDIDGVGSFAIALHDLIEDHITPAMNESETLPPLQIPMIVDVDQLIDDILQERISGNGDRSGGGGGALPSASASPVGPSSPGVASGTLRTDVILSSVDIDVFSDAGSAATDDSGADDDDVFSMASADDMSGMRTSSVMSMLHSEDIASPVGGSVGEAPSSLLKIWATMNKMNNHRGGVSTSGDGESGAAAGGAMDEGFVDALPRRLQSRLLSTSVKNHKAAPLSAALHLGLYDCGFAIASISLVNPNQPDDHGNTPLSIAVLYDQPKMVEYLLFVRSASLAPCNYSGYSALHIALLNGRDECLKVMFSHPTALSHEVLNCTTPAKSTSVSLALKLNKLDILQKLLSLGATATRADKNNVTPLLYALRHNMVEAAEMLFEEVHFTVVDVNIKERKTPRGSPILYAVNHGHAHFARKLLTLGADTSTVFENNSCTVLHTAVLSEDEETAAVFISEAKGEQQVNLNAVEKKFEMTALHMCCERGLMQTMKLLLQNGVDVNIRNKQGHTPLMQCVSSGYADCALAFMTTCRRRLKVEQQDKAGNTALVLAAQLGLSDVVTSLIEACNADVNTVNNAGLSPIATAIQHDHSDTAETIMYLAGPRIDLSQTRPNVPTVMELALMNGQERLAQLILETSGGNVPDELKETLKRLKEQQRSSRPQHLSREPSLVDDDARGNAAAMLGVSTTAMAAESTNVAIVPLEHVGRNRARPRAQVQVIDERADSPDFSMGAEHNRKSRGSFDAAAEAAEATPSSTKKSDSSPQRGSVAVGFLGARKVSMITAAPRLASLINKLDTGRKVLLKRNSVAVFTELQNQLETLNDQQGGGGGTSSRRASVAAKKLNRRGSVCTTAGTNGALAAQRASVSTGSASQTSPLLTSQGGSSNHNASGTAARTATAPSTSVTQGGTGTIAEKILAVVLDNCTTAREAQALVAHVLSMDVDDQQQQQGTPPPKGTPAPRAVSPPSTLHVSPASSPANSARPPLGPRRMSLSGSPSALRSPAASTASRFPNLLSLEHMSDDELVSKLIGLVSVHQITVTNLRSLKAALMQVNHHLKKLISNARHYAFAPLAPQGYEVDLPRKEALAFWYLCNHRAGEAVDYISHFSNNKALACSANVPPTSMDFNASTTNKWSGRNVSLLHVAVLTENPVAVEYLVARGAELTWSKRNDGELPVPSRLVPEEALYPSAMSSLPSSAMVSKRTSVTSLNDASNTSASSPAYARVAIPDLYDDLYVHIPDPLACAIRLGSRVVTDALLSVIKDSVFAQIDETGVINDPFPLQTTIFMATTTRHAHTVDIRETLAAVPSQYADDYLAPPTPSARGGGGTGGSGGGRRATREFTTGGTAIDAHHHAPPALGSVLPPPPAGQQLSSPPPFTSPPPIPDALLGSVGHEYFNTATNERVPFAAYETTYLHLILLSGPKHSLSSSGAHDLLLKFVRFYAQLQASLDGSKPPNINDYSFSMRSGGGADVSGIFEAPRDVDSFRTNNTDNNTSSIVDGPGGGGSSSSHDVSHSVKLYAGSTTMSPGQLISHMHGSGGGGDSDLNVSSILPSLNASNLPQNAPPVEIAKPQQTAVRTSIGSGSAGTGNSSFAVPPLSQQPQQQSHQHHHHQARELRPGDATSIVTQADAATGLSLFSLAMVLEADAFVVWCIDGQHATPESVQNNDASAKRKNSTVSTGGSSAPLQPPSSNKTVPEMKPFANSVKRRKLKQVDFDVLRCCVERLPFLFQFLVRAGFVPNECVVKRKAFPSLPGPGGLLNPTPPTSSPALPIKKRGSTVNASLLAGGRRKSLQGSAMSPGNTGLTSPTQQGAHLLALEPARRERTQLLHHVLTQLRDLRKKSVDINLDRIFSAPGGPQQASTSSPGGEGGGGAPKTGDPMQLLSDVEAMMIGSLSRTGRRGTRGRSTAPNRSSITPEATVNQRRAGIGLDGLKNDEQKVKEFKMLRREGALPGASSAQAAFSALNGFREVTAASTSAGNSKRGAGGSSLSPPRSRAASPSPGDAGSSAAGGVPGRPFSSSASAFSTRKPSLGSYGFGTRPQWQAASADGVPPSGRATNEVGATAGASAFAATRMGFESATEQEMATMEGIALFLIEEFTAHNADIVAAAKSSSAGTMLTSPVESESAYTPVLAFGDATGPSRGATQANKGNNNITTTTATSNKMSWSEEQVGTGMSLLHLACQCRSARVIESLLDVIETPPPLVTTHQADSFAFKHETQQLQHNYKVLAEQELRRKDALQCSPLDYLSKQFYGPSWSLTLTRIVDLIHVSKERRHFLEGLSQRIHPVTFSTLVIHANVVHAFSLPKEVKEASSTSAPSKFAAAAAAGGNSAANANRSSMKRAGSPSFRSKSPSVRNGSKSPSRRQSTHPKQLDSPNKDGNATTTPTLSPGRRVSLSPAATGLTSPPTGAPLPSIKFVDDGGNASAITSPIKLDGGQPTSSIGKRGSILNLNASNLVGLGSFVASKENSFVANPNGGMSNIFGGRVAGEGFDAPKLPPAARRHKSRRSSSVGSIASSKSTDDQPGGGVQASFEVLSSESSCSSTSDSEEAEEFFGGGSNGPGDTENMSGLFVMRCVDATPRTKFTQPVDDGTAIRRFWTGLAHTAFMGSSEQRSRGLKKVQSLPQTLLLCANTAVVCNLLAASAAVQYESGPPSASSVAGGPAGAAAAPQSSRGSVAARRNPSPPKTRPGSVRAPTSPVSASASGGVDGTGGGSEPQPVALAYIPLPGLASPIELLTQTAVTTTASSVSAASASMGASQKHHASSFEASMTVSSQKQMALQEQRMFIADEARELHHQLCGLTCFRWAKMTTPRVAFQGASHLMQQHHQHITSNTSTAGSTRNSTADREHGTSSGGGARNIAAIRPLASLVGGFAKLADMGKSTSESSNAFQPAPPPTSTSGGGRSARGGGGASGAGVGSSSAASSGHHTDEVGVEALAAVFLGLYQEGGVALLVNEGSSGSGGAAGGGGASSGSGSLAASEGGAKARRARAAKGASSTGQTAGTSEFRKEDVETGDLGYAVPPSVFVTWGTGLSALATRSGNVPLLSTLRRRTLLASNSASIKSAVTAANAAKDLGNATALASATKSFAAQSALSQMQTRAPIQALSFDECKALLLSEFIHSQQNALLAASAKRHQVLFFLLEDRKLTTTTDAGSTPILDVALRDYPGHCPRQRAACEACAKILLHARSPISIDALEFFRDHPIVFGINYVVPGHRDTLLHVAVLNDCLDVVKGLLIDKSFQKVLHSNEHRLRAWEYASRQEIIRPVIDASVVAANRLSRMRELLDERHSFRLAEEELRLQRMKEEAAEIGDRSNDKARQFMDVIRAAMAIKKVEQAAEAAMEEEQAKFYEGIGEGDDFGDKSGSAEEFDMMAKLKEGEMPTPSLSPQNSPRGAGGMSPKAGSGSGSATAASTLSATAEKSMQKAIEQAQQDNAMDDAIDKFNVSAAQQRIVERLKRLAQKSKDKLDTKTAAKHYNSMSVLDSTGKPLVSFQCAVVSSNFVKQQHTDSDQSAALTGKAREALAAPKVVSKIQVASLFAKAMKDKFVSSDPARAANEELREREREEKSTGVPATIISGMWNHGFVIEGEDAFGNHTMKVATFVAANITMPAALLAQHFRKICQEFAAVQHHGEGDGNETHRHRKTAPKRTNDDTVATGDQDSTGDGTTSGMSPAQLWQTLLPNQRSTFQEVCRQRRFSNRFNLDCELFLLTDGQKEKLLHHIASDELSTLALLPPSAIVAYGAEAKMRTSEESTKRNDDQHHHQHQHGHGLRGRHQQAHQPNIDDASSEASTVLPSSQPRTQSPQRSSASTSNSTTRRPTANDDLNGSASGSQLKKKKKTHLCLAPIYHTNLQGLDDVSGQFASAATGNLRHPQSARPGRMQSPPRGGAGSTKSGANAPNDGSASARRPHRLGGLASSARM